MVAGRERGKATLISLKRPPCQRSVRRVPASTRPEQQPALSPAPRKTTGVRGSVSRHHENHRKCHAHTPSHPHSTLPKLKPTRYEISGLESLNILSPPLQIERDQSPPRPVPGCLGRPRRQYLIGEAAIAVPFDRTGRMVVMRRAKGLSTLCIVVNHRRPLKFYDIL